MEDTAYFVCRVLAAYWRSLLTRESLCRYQAGGGRS